MIELINNYYVIGIIVLIVCIIAFISHLKNTKEECDCTFLYYDYDCHCDRETANSLYKSMIENLKSLLKEEGTLKLAIFAPLCILLFLLVMLTIVQFWLIALPICIFYLFFKFLKTKI